MFIAKVPNRSSPPCYLLRESHRVGGTVSTTTLANLSHLELSQIEAIAAALKGQQLVPLEQALTINRSLPHGQVAAIVGTLRKLGVDRHRHGRFEAGDRDEGRGDLREESGEEAL